MPSPGVTPKNRSYSHYSQKAVSTLGSMVRLYRKKRRLTLKDLADRAGISPTTLRKIEKGDMTCEIGLFFEAAALVGVPLFEKNIHELEVLEESVIDKIALLPKSIRAPKEPVDDNF